MADRVRTRKGARGAKGYDYKYGGPGYGWEIDTQWYDNDPQYKGALDEMMSLGKFEGTAYSPTSNPTDISTFSSKHNLMNRLNAVTDWLRGGRAAHYAAQAPKPAPAPAAVTTPPPAPSLQPTKIDVSGGPAAVPGPSGGSSTAGAAGGGVFGSGTGAYQAQGVKSAALNPRRERMKLSSFNRGRRPLSLGTLNLA